MKKGAPEQTPKKARSSDESQIESNSNSNSSSSSSSNSDNNRGRNMNTASHEQMSEETFHTQNISRGRNISNDNDNNGMGIARRRPSSPSPSPPPPPPQPSTNMRLLNHDEDLKKLKTTASNDTMSTATGHTGSITNFSSANSHSHSTINTLNDRKKASKKQSASSLSRSRRTQHRMFNQQMTILASISGGSFVLFLFFFLNIFAFTALVVGFSSTMMIFYTAYLYGISVLNGGDGALFDFLPASVQDYLTNTTLHEAMTDDSSFLENRWYLLYFIPGLSPEQVNSMVARLPQRHRDMAYGPGGMARLVLPESVFDLIAPPNARAESGSHGTTAQESTSRGHVMRITDGQAPVVLPVIEEDGEEDENENGSEEEEEEITMQDAFQGILRNARTLVAPANSEDATTEVTESQPNIEYNDMSWDDLHEGEDEFQETRIEVHVVHDSDSETSDLGLDVAADDFTGRMNDSQLGRLGRMIGLRRPQTPETSSSSPRARTLPPTTVSADQDVIISQSLSDLNIVASTTEDDEETLETQQTIEGDILNEAISTMVDNYTTSTTTAISDALTNAAVSIVERVAPSLIRLGTSLSSVASVGLIGMFSTSRMPPLRIMGSAIGGGTGGGTGGVGGGTGRSLSETRTDRYIANGLMSALAMGAISVGGAYGTRYFTRRYAAAKRAADNGAQDGEEKNEQS